MAMNRPDPESGTHSTASVTAAGSAPSAGLDTAAGLVTAEPDWKSTSRARTGEASSIASGSAPRPALWLLLLLLIATVLVGAVGIFTYRYLRDDLQAETQRTLRVIAEQKRQQIENWVAQTRMDAESYFSGHSPHAVAFGQWLDGGRQAADLIERVRSRMAEIARMRRWGGLALYNPEGSAAFIVGEAGARLDQDQIQAVLRHPTITSVDLHLNPQGLAVYGLLAPFGLPGEPPRGVVALTWPVARDLFPLVTSWPLPSQSAETYLVRREGDQVRFLTPLRYQPDANLTLTRPLDTPALPAARAAQGQLGILEGGRDYRGMPVLAYATAIAGTDWLMIAEIDEAEAYAGIQASARGTALIAGLTLLLLYGVGYDFWRRDRQRREFAALRAQQDVEARFRTLFEASSEAVMLLDARGFLDCNPAALRIFGVPDKEDFLKLSPVELSPPCQADGRPSSELAPERIAQALEEGHRTFEWLHRRADTGQDFPAEVVLSAIDLADGQVLLATVRDFTERKRLEDRLRDNEARIRRMLEHLPTPIAVSSVHASRPVLFYNQAFTRAFGYTLEDIPTVDDWYRRAYPDADYRANVISRWNEAFPGAMAARGVMDAQEYRVTCKDGEVRDVLISANALDDMQLVSFVDVSERKAYERKLEIAYEAAATANRQLQDLNRQLNQIATTDALTGVWNRRHFEQVVVTELARAQRYHEPLALLLIDVDHFKAINDHHGHQVGDQVLVELMRRIQAHLRAADVLARWGGEEFVALLPQTPAGPARSLAERLRRLVAAEPFPEAGKVTASFGLAQLQPRETLDAWLKRVDDALYAAKAAGRDCVRGDG